MALFIIILNKPFFRKFFEKVLFVSVFCVFLHYNLKHKKMNYLQSVKITNQKIEEINSRVNPYTEKRIKLEKENKIERIKMEATLFGLFIIGFSTLIYIL